MEGILIVVPWDYARICQLLGPLAIMSDSVKRHAQTALTFFISNSVATHT